MKRCRPKAQYPPSSDTLKRAEKNRIPVLVCHNNLDVEPWSTMSIIGNFDNTLRYLIQETGFHLGGIRLVRWIGVEEAEAQRVETGTQQHA